LAVVESKGRQLGRYGRPALNDVSALDCQSTHKINEKGGTRWSFVNSDVWFLFTAAITQAAKRDGSRLPVGRSSPAAGNLDYRCASGGGTACSRRCLQRTGIALSPARRNSCYLYMAAYVPSLKSVLWDTYICVVNSSQAELSYIGQGGRTSEDREGIRKRQRPLLT